MRNTMSGLGTVRVWSLQLWHTSVTWQQFWVRLCIMWPDRNLPKSWPIPDTAPCFQGLFWFARTQVLREKERCISCVHDHTNIKYVTSCGYRMDQWYELMRNRKLYMDFENRTYVS